jgi:hypothetical protein
MVTKIDEAILKDPELLRNISIAKRMSWAASRKTTREEDIAYCLMGIFDVNMPLLYGEGLKAFSRLQQEILKESIDQSLLAWDNFSGCVPDATGATTGAFADHPRRFKDAANITRFDALALFDGKGAASIITNGGLEIYLPVLVKHDLDVTTKVEYTVILACHRAEDIAKPLGISLQPVKGSRGRVFCRTVSRLSLDPV